MLVLPRPQPFREILLGVVFLMDPAEMVDEAYRLLVLLKRHQFREFIGRLPLDFLRDFCLPVFPVLP